MLLPLVPCNDDNCVGWGGVELLALVIALLAFFCVPLRPMNTGFGGSLFILMAELIPSLARRLNPPKKTYLIP